MEITISLSFLIVLVITTLFFYNIIVIETFYFRKGFVDIPFYKNKTCLHLCACFDMRGFVSFIMLSVNLIPHNILNQYDLDKYLQK